MRERWWRGIRKEVDRPGLAAAVGVLLTLLPVFAKADGLVEIEGDFAAHPRPSDIPVAVAHLPASLTRERRLDVVLFLHGWRGCARVLAGSGNLACRPREALHPGWGLAEIHRDAGTRNLFLLPQLAYRAREGSPGRFAEPGFARRFLHRCLRAIQENLGRADAPSLGKVTVVAHSAGYRTALALVEHGGLERSLRHIVLFDALYDGVETFAEWLRRDPGRRRIVSVHAPRGETKRNTAALRDRVARTLGMSAVRVERGHLHRPIDTPMTEVVSPHAHGAIPTKHLREVLVALDAAPP